MVFSLYSLVPIIFSRQVNKERKLYSMNDDFLRRKEEREKIRSNYQVYLTRSFYGNENVLKELLKKIKQ